MGTHSHIAHMPVMKEETVSYLLTDPSGIYLDCTLGAGGHAKALLQGMNPQGRLIGIDRDEFAIANFQRQVKRWPCEIHLFHSRYSLMADLLGSQSISQVDGVLFDLGIASFQIDNPERGFSYLHDGPLDMRMDSAQGITASMVVNEYGEGDLAIVIRDYGEERRWRRIARAIVQARARSPIETTTQLAEIITGVVPEPQAIKSLSRCFQALRIEVNQELAELRAGLAAAVDVLKLGGRLVVICYQSLEDRAVKEIFARLRGVCQCPKGLPQCVCDAQKVIKVLTPKIVRPTAREIESNSRARSARLRAAEKIVP
jgi:16S rRNA (cytosine1402-N4)-methyltransferase